MIGVLAPPRPDRATLEALRERIRAAAGADRQLDAEIWMLLSRPAYAEDFPLEAWPNGDVGWIGWRHRAPFATSEAYTGSLDVIVGLVERVLPGFWQSSGLCSLTGHASIGPDYNGPHADRLRQEWPEEQFHEGFHADLKPGDGRHRQCLALIDTVLQALIDQVDAA